MAAAPKTKKVSNKNGLCRKCTGLCCRYFALPIDTPEDPSDYNDIRWYLCHKNVTVFVEQGQWYLNVNNRCRYLCNTQHHCRIYHIRPGICRTYKTADCDRTGSDYDYQLHFTSDRQMEEYMKIKFGTNVLDRLGSAKKAGRHPRKKTRRTSGK